MVAYSYQCNLFPIYCSLREKNNEQYMKVNNYGLLLTLFIYITVAVISVAMFGAQVSTVVLENIGQARHDGKAFWEGYITQLAFVVLLSCHIPFIFFAGKEGLLIIVDELDRKSISNALFHKLFATNEYFEKEHRQDMPPAPQLPIPGGDEKIMAFDDKQLDAEQLRESRITAMQSAKERLTTLTQAEANRLAYKDMKPALYYLSTLGFFGTVIASSSLIPSVSIVLDLIGAITVSMLVFGFPSMFYLGAKKRFGKSDSMYVKISYLYAFLTVLNCVLGLSSTVLGVI
jgi:hypothetical protein